MSLFKHRVLRCIAVIAIGLSTSFPIQAESDRGCAVRHLKEAIALNKERAADYARLSSGRSRKLSSRLVFMERLSLIPAQVADILAAKWQKKGIAMLCDDFVPMSDTPSFLGFDSDFQQSCTADDALPDTRALIARLQAAFSVSNMVLASAVHQELESLEAFNARLCMTRHILESIRRSAQLVPIYEAQAMDANLPSPAYISNAFIYSQIKLLTEAVKLDADLRSIHAMGIPMVCRDVPPIPPVHD